MLSGIIFTTAASMLVISLVGAGVCIMHDDTRDWKLNMASFSAVTFGFGIMLANASGVIDDASGDMITPASDIAGMTLIIAILMVFGGVGVIAFVQWRSQVLEARQRAEFTYRFVERKFTQACVAVRNKTIDVKHAAQAVLPRSDA